MFSYLVVEPTHLEKYARQIGSFPPGRVENKKYLSCHHLVLVLGGVVLEGLLILTVSGDRGLYHP